MDALELDGMRELPRAVQDLQEAEEEARAQEAHVVPVVQEGHAASGEVLGKRVFISGPMSAYAETGWNKESFDRVRDMLVEAGARLVVSPADIACKVESGEITEQEAKAHDLRNLLMCDTVVMLDGWGMSDGALLEWMVAKDTGKEIIGEWDVGRSVKHG